MSPSPLSILRIPLLAGLICLFFLHPRLGDVIAANPDIPNCQTTASPEANHVTDKLAVYPERGDSGPLACVISLHNVPADATISCIDIQGLSNPVTISASADCCQPLTLALVVDTLAGGPCPEVFQLVRTWTATDACGNTKTAQQHLSIVDYSPPLFTVVPPTVTVECSDIPPPPTPGVGIQAEDACGVTVTITMQSSAVPGICPQSYTLTRTWTAADICGNTSTAKQTLYVVDTQAPQFLDPPADMTISCHVIPDPAPNLTILDNCAAQIEKTFTETMSGGGDCDLTIITRTWSTEDQCGNSDTYIQTITRGDTGGPVFSNIPPDATVECDDIPTADPGVTDDCDLSPEVIELTTLTPGSCPGNYTLLREWTASDDCGHVTTASQTLTVMDTHPPVITFTNPSLLALSSGDTLKSPCIAVETFDVHDAIVTDACDPDPVVLFIDSLIYDDGCKKLLYCEWRATDHCQNTSSFIFYMLVGDFEAPVLSNIPANLTISCELPIPAAGTPNVTDDCDLGPKILFQETTITGSCPQAYQLIRTWTAVDNCGNTNAKSQTISVIDQKAPVLTPVDPFIAGLPSGSMLTVQCGQEPTFVSASVSATDNCDQSVSVGLQLSTVESDCSTSGYIRDITYTWTGTDDCGNSITYIIIVRVIDTIAPNFVTIPADVTLDCQDNLPTTTPTGSDNCGGLVEFTYQDDAQVTACTTLVTRTWIATDPCQNTVTATQTITLIDTSPPTLVGVPADITLSCTDPVPSPADVKVADDCDPDPSIELEESIEPGNCKGNYILTRTWYTTDACGNNTASSQIITVEDTDSPVFTLTPPDITVNCHQIPDGSGDVLAEDLCNTVIIYTWTDDVVDGQCTGEYQINRTFVADDGCGNNISVIQHIQVIDTLPPVFGPDQDDLTVSCDHMGSLPSPLVSDYCDPNVILHDSTLSETPGSCSGESTRVVQWTAVDDCGNTATAVISYHVIDQDPPTITPVLAILQNQVDGSTIQIECDQVPVMDESSVSAVDLCDANPVVVFAETVEFGDCLADGYLYRLTCTWTATDDCGNSASYQIYIEVVDHTAPVFPNPPSDLTVEVKNGKTIPAPPVIQAEDACDSDPDVMYAEFTEPVECGYLLIRTWTAVDDCGNESSISQTLLIDEGCPCQKPHIELIDKKDPKFGVNNGVVTIHLLEEEADYAYLWIPNNGTPNAVGNSRSGLSPGTYQVFINDPKASASCFIKVNITLTMMWTCIDTVYVTIPKNDPSEVCVDPVLDLMGPVVSASVCGFDPLAIEAVVVDPQTGCVQIDPVTDFIGTSTICVIHCDASNPPICDTTYIIVTINALVDPPCEDILTDNLLSTTITNCVDQGMICLPMSPDELLPYSLTMDGLDYNPKMTGCDFQDRVTYSLSMIPGGGNQGPYTLNEWSVNGQVFSGAFENLDELVDLLNLWDPAGKWRSTNGNKLLQGGLWSNQYGTLTMTQHVSGTSVSLSATNASLPQGVILSLEEGEHLLVVTHTTTGCTDEIILSVECEEVEKQLVALNDKIKTTRNQAVEINILVNDYIPNGQLTDILIVSQPAHGTAILQQDHRVRYIPEPDFCALDTFTYVICNASGCDTASVCVDVACQELIIYTGFSPNGDGINDTFTIDGIEAFPNNKLSVWNRWGNLIYKVDGYKNQWGGTWQSSDLPDGTYFYILDDGVDVTYKGYVQIQR